MLVKTTELYFLLKPQNQVFFPQPEIMISCQTLTFSNRNCKITISVQTTILCLPSKTINHFLWQNNKITYICFAKIVKSRSLVKSSNFLSCQNENQIFCQTHKLKFSLKTAKLYFSPKLQNHVFVPK